MRNGEGGTVPSYNVQLLTDTTHGLVVNVEATTDAIDYRQLNAALERCQTKLGVLPEQIVADGDYTNHASVQAAASCKVNFYGSWQDSWKPTEYDAQGRTGEFIGNAFPYDAEHDVYLCPAGQRLTHHAVLNREHGVRTMAIEHPRQPARAAHTVINAPRRRRRPTGDGPSHAWRNRRRQLPSRPRWKPMRRSKSTSSDPRSRSSRMPGSRNVVGCGNFDVEDD